MSIADLPDELRRAIVTVARTPRLLVASDYDGTLAPIVPDPARAFPHDEAVRALRQLAGLPATSAAVISGRALRDLATLSRLPSEVHLVGSHGSEFDVGFIHEVAPEAKALLARVVEALSDIAAATPGATVEAKPASAALHVRNSDPDDAEKALTRARDGAAHWSGVHVTEGKCVVELAVVETDKGNALQILRHQFGATAAIFFGDDVTDERAFIRLQGPDVGVRVGNAPSVAGYRVKDTASVAVALAFLLEERQTWLSGASAPQIERLTMLASPRSVALVTPDANITWLCHPEPDSAAIFAHLLGGSDAGEFRIAPQRAALPQSQRYVNSTMTVETRWASLTVLDYLPHDVGPMRTDLTRVITGEAPAVITFAPRPEFGQVHVRLAADGDGLRVFGPNDPIVLRSPGVEWTIESQGVHQVARAVVDPSKGPVVLELRCGSWDLNPSHSSEADRRALAETDWHAWSTSLDLPKLETDLIRRSALTLRGLVHRPSGSILAAATTSLPEDIGGVRNWDYRYCWLRDAALTSSALISVGSLREAEDYLDWIHDVLSRVSGPERLHPLYTLYGLALPPEAVIDALPGYAGSRPVRVGNAANMQLQLDVFGPIVELISDLAHARKKRGSANCLPNADWALVEAMVEAVERRWHEPDHGIWEIRDRPRHHVYSKVMGWLTVDRALRLAAEFGRTPHSDWSPLREAIQADVLEHGWNPAAKAFTAAYDGTDLDAASLHIGLSGLLKPNDRRFINTVDAIEEELRSGSTVYRYRHDDGLPGGEGGFHLCAAWLIEAYLLIDRRSDAEVLFDQLVRASGPTGLLSEEYDPVAERSLGNHPQAYSHLGLIRCARLLDNQAP